MIDTAGKTGGHTHGKKAGDDEYTHGKKAGDDGHTEGGTGGKSGGHTA